VGLAFWIFIRGSQAADQISRLALYPRTLAVGQDLTSIFGEASHKLASAGRSRAPGGQAEMELLQISRLFRGI
jgi:hypothetical protein